MNDTLSKILIFTAGATIGSVVTWKILETKYERLIKEEIESVKAAFSKRAEDDTVEEEDVSANDVFDEKTKQTYSDLLENYAGDLNEKVEKGGSERMEIGTPPKVIAPEEFGEIEEYETISLTYYADGVLTDDDNEVIEDVDMIVGSDSLNRFGEFEDDSVFVRNTRLKCDYEILMDYRKYSDVVNTNLDPECDE